MSQENVRVNPMGHLAEMVLHNLHTIKQKEKFRKFQPYRGPRQNPYTKDRSSRFKAGIGHSHNRSLSLNERRYTEEADRSSIHKPIVVAENDVKLPKIHFHEKSFEDKYKGEIKEFKKFYRHNKHTGERRISRNMLLDEVLQEHTGQNSYPDAECTSFNISVTDTKLDPSSKESRIISLRHKGSLILK